MHSDPWETKEGTYGSNGQMTMTLHITVTSWWGRWRLKSPASPLFTPPFIQWRSKKTCTSKLCVTSLCVGNSPETGEFPAQMASSAENVSIWWRHHDNNKSRQLPRNFEQRKYIKLLQGYALWSMKKSILVTWANANDVLRLKVWTTA